MKQLAGIVMASAGLLLAGAADAGPQYGRGYADGRDALIRCESKDGRTERCELGMTVNWAKLVKQTSSSPCIEGRTWGRDRTSLWVSNGCRGEFAVQRGGVSNGRWDNDRRGSSNGQTFRCESQDGRYRECATNGRSARMVRQLSDASCVQGRTWGTTRNGVWVDRGCRAEFSSGTGWGNHRNRYDRDDYRGDYGYGQTLRCESQDNRTRQCNASIRRDVRLVRQLSDTRCIEGQNWGWDRRGVWVSRGCRAEFEIR